MSETMGEREKDIQRNDPRIPDGPAWVLFLLSFSRLVCTPLKIFHQRSWTNPICALQPTTREKQLDGCRTRKEMHLQYWLEPTGPSDESVPLHATNRDQTRSSDVRKVSQATYLTIVLPLRDLTL